MNIVIVRSDHTVMIDNAPLEIDLEDFLPENIEMVTWAGFSPYYGEIEYNDRARLLEKFYDITSLHPIVQTYMRHLPGLRLAQAKRLQIDFMDAIVGAACRLPIKVDIKREKTEPIIRERTWMARDVDIAVATTNVIPDILGTVGKTSSGLAGMISSINYHGNQTTSGINALIYSIPSYTQSRWIRDPWVSVLCAQPGMFPGSARAPAEVFPVISVPWGVPVPQTNVANGVGVNEGGTSWPTIDPLALVEVSGREAGTIMQAIGKRANVLKKIFYRRVREVLRLTTMADVIDYPATDGWPS